MNSQNYTYTRPASIFKRWIVSLIIVEVFLLIVMLIGRGLPPPLAFMQSVLWLTAGIILGVQKDRACRTFAVALLSSVLAVMILSITGFYTSTQRSSGEFDTYGTRVSSHSIDNGISSALTDPATFTAALFGYECPDKFNAGCSDNLYYAGIGIVQMLFVLGIVIGLIRARRNTALPPEIDE